MNGTVGKVIDFLTPLEAVKKGIKSITADGVSVLAADSQNQSQNRPTLSKLPSDRIWPVVLFNTQKSQEVLLCTSESFEVNNAEGLVEASRAQVYRNSFTLYCVHRVTLFRSPLFWHGLSVSTNHKVRR